MTKISYLASMLCVVMLSLSADTHMLPTQAVNSTHMLPIQAVNSTPRPRHIPYEEAVRLATEDLLILTPIDHRITDLQEQLYDLRDQRARRSFWNTHDPLLRQIRLLEDAIADLELQRTLHILTAEWQLRQAIAALAHTTAELDALQPSLAHQATLIEAESLRLSVGLAAQLDVKTTALAVTHAQAAIIQHYYHNWVLYFTFSHPFLPG